MEKALAVGDPTPPFHLATDRAAAISPETLKGKPFVLYFYPKDDTSGCTREAVGFSQLSKKFEALGTTVIGVSKDSVASHEKFRSKHKLTIMLASDPDIQAAQAFGVWVEKSLYGRRYMGLERATFLIDAKGIIRQIWRKVRVPGHVDAVLEAAKKL